MRREAATARLREAGLDESAASNLVAYLAEQQATTGALPTDRTVVFERFRDELGDWRVCVHCPLGTGVLNPWALAVEHAARERYGMEVQATATNDGMVLRIPDTESQLDSAKMQPGRCCYLDATRSHVRRCGNSGCARPNC
jgi:ATP-dependent Lhr-like helicase